MRAEDSLRREIHIGRVARRDVVRAEDDASRSGNVGRDFVAAREIPLPDGGLEAAAVDGARGWKHGV